MRQNLLSLTQALLWCGVCLMVAIPTKAKNTRTTYTFTINRTAEQTTPTVCEIHTNVLTAKLGTDAIAGLASGTVRFCAIQGTTGKVSRATTLPPYGQYFNEEGNVVVESRGVVSSQFNGKNAFNVNTLEDKVSKGDKFYVQQVFIATNTNDTVAYAFDITIGDSQSVDSDEPVAIHRPDKIDSWLAKPYVRRNEQEPEYVNFIQVNAGDNLTIGLRPINEGETIKFSIKGPN